MGKINTGYCIDGKVTHSEVQIKLETPAAVILINLSWLMFWKLAVVLRAASVTGRLWGGLNSAFFFFPPQGTAAGNPLTRSRCPPGSFGRATSRASLGAG